MIYTIEQIKELSEPIAQKYKLAALWVFGSYARDEATEDSDIDFLMDDSDSLATNLLDFVDMTEEFKQILNKKIDLLTIETLNAPSTKRHYSKFINTVIKERLVIYEKNRDTAFLEHIIVHCNKIFEYNLRCGDSYDHLLSDTL
jgi:predicted nucleotidyltransferase